MGWVLIVLAAAIAIGLPLFENKHGLQRRAEEARRDEEKSRKTTSKWRAVLNALAALDQQRSLDQLEELLAKCERLDEVLKSRFAATELASGRYRVVADEVRLGVLNNLQRQVELLQAVQHIDREEIEKRIRQLKPGSPASVELEKALYERLNLRQDVESRIERMNASNELALNALDKAIVTISDLDTRKAHDASQLESAVAELEEMVSSAHALAGSPQDLELYGSPKGRKDDKGTIELSGGSS